MLKKLRDDMSLYPILFKSANLDARTKRKTGLLSGIETN